MGVSAMKLLDHSKSLMADNCNHLIISKVFADSIGAWSCPSQPH